MISTLHYQKKKKKMTILKMYNYILNTSILLKIDKNKKRSVCISKKN